MCRPAVPPGGQTSHGEGESPASQLGREFKTTHWTEQTPHSSVARPSRCHPERGASALGEASGWAGGGAHWGQRSKKYLCVALLVLVLSHPALACETASLDIVFVINNSRKALPAVLTVAQNSCSEFSSRDVRRCQVLCPSVRTSVVQGDQPQPSRASLCSAGISITLLKTPQ